MRSCLCVEVRENVSRGRKKGCLTATDLCGALAKCSSVQIHPHKSFLCLFSKHLYGQAMEISRGYKCCDGHIASFLFYVKASFFIKWMNEWMNETFVEHNQTTLTGFENMFHGPIKSKIFLNQNFMKKKKAYPTLKHDSGSIILWARVAASGNSEMFPMHIYSLCSNRNLSQRWPSFGIPLILCKHPEWLPMKLTGACYMQFLCKRLHKNAVQSNFYIKNTIQQQPGIFFFFKLEKKWYWKAQYQS